MRIHAANAMRIASIFSGLLMPVIGHAAEIVTLTYTGKLFNLTNGGSGPPPATFSDSITGTVDFSWTPTASAVTLSQNNVIDWSFSDGPTTYTSSNAYVLYGFYIVFVNGAVPNWGISLSDAPGGIATQGYPHIGTQYAPPDAYDGDNGTLSSYTGTYAFDDATTSSLLVYNGVPGTWAVSYSGGGRAPEAGSFFLLAPFMLLLAFLSFRPAWLQAP